MKLIRKNGHAHASGSVPVGGPAQAIGRRTFLRRSGIAMGGAHRPAQIYRRASPELQAFDRTLR